MKRFKHVPETGTCVTISHGQSIYHYILVRDFKQDGHLIEFTGYVAVPFGQHDHCYHDRTTDEILSFNTGCWPSHRIENLHACLRAGKLGDALIEYARTDKGKKPIIHRPFFVKACGNWSMRTPQT